jgi:hypothetical protein
MRKKKKNDYDEDDIVSHFLFYRIVSYFILSYTACCVYLPSSFSWYGCRPIQSRDGFLRSPSTWYNTTTRQFDIHIFISTAHYYLMYRIKIICLNTRSQPKSFFQRRLRTIKNQAAKVRDSNKSIFILKLREERVLDLLIIQQEFNGKYCVLLLIKSDCLLIVTESDTNTPFFFS